MTCIACGRLVEFISEAAADPSWADGSIDIRKSSLSDLRQLADDPVADLNSLERAVLCMDCFGHIEKVFSLC